MHRFAIVLGLCLLPVSALPQSVQEHVHHTGHQVMPFELKKTLHLFRMTETGGVQHVVIRSVRWKNQLPLIQKHLQHEADLFRQGNFGDPARLHGASMPGLRELSASAGKMEISYAALPNGAELVFKTGDPALVTAIHRWFGAQLSEHGPDARAE